MRVLHFLVIGLLLFSAVPAFSSQVGPEGTVLTSYTNPRTEVNVLPGYYEDAWISVSDEGYIRSSASFNGIEPVYAGTDLASTIDSSIISILSYASFSFREASSPGDRNVHFSFQFETSDAAIAQSSASSILSVLASASPLTDVNIDDVRVEGTWTNVWGNAHLDWPDAGSVIDQSMPRLTSGLSATINTTEMSYANIWLDKYDTNSLLMNIEVNFDSEFTAQSGGHSVNLLEQLHVSSISVYNNLNINVRLPKDVSNVVSSIGNTASSTVSTYQNDYEYRVDISLSGGLYSSASISFDYTFIQWSWVQREEVSWSTDRRGYLNAHAYVSGKELASPSTNLLFNSSLLGDLVDLYLYEYDQINNGSYSYFQVLFVQGSDFTSSLATAQGIANELNTLGASYTYSWNTTNWEDNSSYWTQWYNNQEVKVDGIEFSFNTNRTTMETFYNNMYVVQNSAVLQAISYDEIDHFSWNMFKDRWGYGYTFSVNHQRYDVDNGNTAADYTQGINQVFSQSLLNMPVFNLGGTVPFASNTEEIRLSFATFTSDMNSVDFAPGDFDSSSSNDRWGSYSGQGFYSWANVWNDTYENRFYDYRLNYYIEITAPTQYAGPYSNWLVSDYNITWRNTYLGNNVDLEAPWVSDIYYHDPAYGGSSLPEYNNYRHLNYGQIVNGTFDFAVRTSDSNSPDYWNGTHYVDRFPSSGISSMELSMYRVDTPIRNSKFYFDVPMTLNSSWSYYTAEAVFDGTLDTTNLPDGRWRFEGNVSDNAGNINRWTYWEEIEVDNYPDTLPQAVGTFTTLAEGDPVKNMEWINFTVSDETGIYSTILWVGTAGYILEPDTVVKNATGEFHTYSFKYEFGGLPEDYNVALSIEVLDMDGHWSKDTINVFVDNIPMGVEPVLGVPEPADLSVFNNSEVSTILFSINITEDVGVKRVTLQISGPQVMTFDMFDHDNDTMYTFLADITVWAVGSYSYYIEVEDMDQNTHIVSTGTYSFEVVGDITSTDVTDPTVSLVSPSDGDVVTGYVMIEASASDDYGIAQVTVTLPGGEKKQMVLDGSTYKYSWDSTSVVDGSHELTVIAKDLAGNSDSVTFTLTTDNGRRNEVPDLGLPLPGFDFYMAISSFLVAAVILRKRR